MKSGTFENFNIDETIKKALRELEFTKPTEVQERVIPSVLEKHDLIIKAQTGSGKTAAYAIPICEMVEWLENRPQALVLTPTRELAVQIQEDFTNIGRFKRLKAAAVYGQHHFTGEQMELKQKTHVVVGTPGRILDHIKRGTLAVAKINYLVIDEADKMFDMGFMEQLESILKELPGERVTLLCSATMPEKVRSMSCRHMRNPITVDVHEAEITSDKIRHYLYNVEEKGKPELLEAVTIMENPDSCMIFCKTKAQVDLVHKRLADLDYSCGKLHGGLEQDVRLAAMNRFKRGEFRYLITTDVASRGIDVSEVSLVVNYDMPTAQEDYIHRTGRTGRAGLSGKAITFATQNEGRYLSEIERLPGFEIEKLLHPSEVELFARKAEFDKKKKAAPRIRTTKSEQLCKEIMKLRFNAGRKKKLRATNFVGVISNIKGVEAEDIGIISIQDTLTYVEILNGKGRLVLEAMKNIKFGSRQLKVSVASEKR